jgi:stearoyl-CoA desaturase (delta-9 desaturase)
MVIGPFKVRDSEQLINVLVYALFHLSCFAVIWTGCTLRDVLICVGLYLVRMWAVTGVYHRLFSHRGYDTSRLFQFILAFIAQTSAQQGVLWWADSHRKHHKYSDTALDPHSPRQHGFWYAHVGWIFAEKSTYKYEMVKDLEKFPELVWLDKHKLMPAIVLGTLVWLCAGWSGLVMGFCISTIILYHCTFFINSLAHVFGKQRYVTGDDSRNNFILALLTLGEGWHNNHHRYPIAARQGFFWWEIDITYYVLKVLSWFGLVWNLRQPPKSLLCGEAHIMSNQVIERVRHAKDLMSSPGFARLRQGMRNLNLEQILMMDRYRLEVLLPVFKKESDNLDLKHKNPSILKRIHKFFVSQEALMNFKARKRKLEILLDSMPALYRVSLFFEKLYEIWQHAKDGSDALYLSIQEWCKKAEETEIEVLRNFAGYLKSNMPVEVK